MLDLIIKNGQCYVNGELKNVDVAIKNGKIQGVQTSKGNIKTIDANIYIHGEGNNLSVKSINGKVRLSEKRIDRDSDLKIYSLNGNIIHK